MNSNMQDGSSPSAKKTYLPVIYFSILLIGYLVFIAYASFYRTDWYSFSKTISLKPEHLFFLSDTIRLHFRNLRDISTNILLYIPLGFLVAMYLASKDKLNLFRISLFWGAIVSFAVETIQAFIGRVSDATDVMSNGVGYLLGYLIAYFSVKRLGLSPAAMLGLDTEIRSDKLNTLVGLRFIYVAIALFTALLPFDLTVSISDIYRKLQAIDGNMPRLIIDPLFHFRNGFNDIQYLTLKLLMFLPLAYLSSTILFFRKQSSLLLPAFHCLLFGITIEFSNIFISSGHSDVLVPILGFLSGLSVAYLVYYFGSQLSQTTEITSHRDRQYLLASVLLIYCLFVLSYALSPYEFELSYWVIRNKINDGANLTPFLPHFNNRSIESAVDLVREFILYVPFGALLSLWLRSLTFEISFRLALALTLLTGSCFAIWLEMLQITVVGRYPDITDVLLAALGSFAGAVIAPLFKIEMTS